MYVKDKTPEICKLAVCQDGLALAKIPKEKRTPELCMLAVKKNGMALDHVPNQTFSICMAAVRSDPNAFRYVSFEHRHSTLLEHVRNVRPSGVERFERLQSAIRWLQRTQVFKSGDVVVFDIDGTLIKKKTPVFRMVQLYKDFVQQGLKVLIVTGRCETKREWTVRQLHKHRLDGYEKLVMFPANVERSQAAVAHFKSTTFETLMPELRFCIGNEWSDVYGAEPMEEDMGPRPFAVSDRWLKVP